jgi:hypothetical protein
LRERSLCNVASGVYLAIDGTLILDVDGVHLHGYKAESFENIQANTVKQYRYKLDSALGKKRKSINGESLDAC